MSSIETQIRLDEGMLRKVTGYYIYRSIDGWHRDGYHTGKARINGVYIDRNEIEGDPPKLIRMRMDW